MKTSYRLEFHIESIVRADGFALVNAGYHGERTGFIRMNIPEADAKGLRDGDKITVIHEVEDAERGDRS